MGHLNVSLLFLILSCGVRLALFAVYIDSVFEKVGLKASGCYIKWYCVSILMYADDILLLAPSVSSLQNLLGICDKNSSGDEIADVNFLTTISHTRRPTSKYRKRDKPTLFNKLDDR